MMNQIKQRKRKRDGGAGRGRFQRKLAVSATALGVALTTSPSPAQEIADASQLEVEEIVVTGTLLRDRDASSANPLTVVGEEEIQQIGAASVNDILARVPALGGQGLGDTTALGQQSGTSFIDLRNLGPTRTLVLVNGRRASQTFGAGPGSVAVDINAIPVSMIDHIDVLRDGASPIYGSDAIAGVVNVMTKRSFEGLQIDASGGSSRYGDRVTGSLSVLGGKELDRGGFMIGVDYTDKGRAGYDERPFYSDRVTAVGFDANGNGIVTQTGLPNLNPGGVVLVGGMPTFTFTGPEEFRAYDAATDSIAADLDQVALTPSRRLSVSANGYFDFTDLVRGYAELSYTHTDSELKDLAMQNRSFIVPASHPNNPFGMPVTMVRAFPETGGAYAEQQQDIYRAVAGIEGELGTFHWDLNYVWGETRAQVDSFNELDSDKLLIGLNPALCASAAGCSLINPFGPGSISQDAVDYFTENSNDENRATLSMITASVSGQPVELPAGPLSVAFGVDYREDKGEYFNETPTETSEYSGSIRAGEVYGELNVPLLRDLPMLQSLSVNGAVRYSDYERFGGATTGKVGLNWAVSDDVRFRGNLGTGFRAPNLSEFFSPTAALGNQRGLVDPCSAPVAPENAAACAAAGVPPGFIDAGGGKPIANGGNPDLEPEKAEQLNVGLVLTPPWIAGLTVTVDYYKVELEDAIVAPSAQFVLDQCYASGASLSSPFCDYVSRDANGTLSEIRSIVQNIGRVETDGLDFGVNYRFDLAGGRLSLNWNSSYLFSYEQQDIPGQPATERAGSLRSSPAVGSYPELKSQLRTTYSRDGWSVGHTLRMIGEAEVLDADPTVNPYNDVSAIFYSDVFAQASLKEVRFTLGVNNLFDKKAPLYFTTAGQRDFGIYDPLGRYVYLRASYTY